MAKLNIVIGGVGGQGVITMGKMLIRAVKPGYKAVASETHGLAQRGGAVNVHVRIGDVYAPLVPLGRADYVIGLEAIEGLRNIRYACDSCVLVLNNKVQRPAIPKVALPTIDELINTAKNYVKVIVLVNAEDLALKAGNVKAVNTVIIGTMLAVGKLRDFVDEEVLVSSLNEVNRKALYLGMENYDIVFSK